MSAGEEESREMAACAASAMLDQELRAMVWLSIDSVRVMLLAEDAAGIGRMLIRTAEQAQRLRHRVLGPATSPENLS